MRQDVMDDFNEKLQVSLGEVEVWQAECGSDAYYRAGPNRRMVVPWPKSMDAYTEATTRVEPEVYETSVS